MKLQNKQTGATLIVALLLMLMLVLGASVAARTGALSSTMAANHQADVTAAQNAESAIANQWDVTAMVDQIGNDEATVTDLGNRYDPNEYTDTASTASLVYCGTKLAHGSSFNSDLAIDAPGLALHTVDVIGASTIAVRNAQSTHRRRGAIVGIASGAEACGDD